jgi:hypothetical protein
MGQWYRFVCDGCAYEAEASGGPDAGMMVIVRTMSCAGCKNIVDVVVAGTHPEPSEDVLAEIGRCPSCGSRDALTEWGREKGSYRSSDDGMLGEEPVEPEVWGVCPRCGGDVRNHGAVAIWD